MVLAAKAWRSAFAPAASRAGRRTWGTPRSVLPETQTEGGLASWCGEAYPGGPSQLSLPHGRLDFWLHRVRRRPALQQLHEPGLEVAKHRRSTRGGEPELEGVHGEYAE